MENNLCDTYFMRAQLPSILFPFFTNLFLFGDESPFFGEQVHIEPISFLRNLRHFFLAVRYLRLNAPQLEVVLQISLVNLKISN